MGEGTAVRGNSLLSADYSGHTLRYHTGVYPEVLVLLMVYQVLASYWGDASAYRQTAVVHSIPVLVRPRAARVYVKQKGEGCIYRSTESLHVQVKPLA